MLGTHGGPAFYNDVASFNFCLQDCWTSSLYLAGEATVPSALSIQKLQVTGEGCGGSRVHLRVVQCI